MLLQTVTAAAVDSARAIVDVHRSYTTWGLVAAVILEGVALALVIAHRGWAWITSAPLTNIRLLNGILQSSLFVLSIMIVGYATGTYPPVDVILALGSFILLMCGLDVTQFGIKRWTTDPNISSTQNVQGGITQGPPTSPPAPLPTPGPTDPSVPTPVPAPVVPTVIAPPPTAVLRPELAAHRYTAGD